MSQAPISSPDAEGGGKALSSGTQVRVIRPGPVPLGMEADDDRGRLGVQVKKRMMEQFFKGDKKLKAEIAWVTSESEREGLRRKGLTKIKVKEASGNTLIFTAPMNNLEKA
jgi:hypothetical protein